MYIYQGLTARRLQRYSIQSLRGASRHYNSPAWFICWRASTSTPLSSKTIDGPRFKPSKLGGSCEKDIARYSTKLQCRFWVLLWYGSRASAAPKDLSLILSKHSIWKMLPKQRRQRQMLRRWHLRRRQNPNLLSLRKCLQCGHNVLQIWMRSSRNRVLR